VTIRGSARYLLAATLVAGAAAVAHAPDSAAAGPGCKDGAYCLWKNKDYKGDKLVVSTDDLSNIPREFNNKVSSLKNRTGVAVRLYTGKDGGGTVYCYPDGVGIQVLGIASNVASSSRTDPAGCG
jgi:hypothetical protein